MSDFPDSGKSPNQYEGGQSHGQQYAPQYGQQYGQPHGQQYGQPYGQQQGQPYGQQQGFSNATVVTTQPNTMVVVQPSQPAPSNYMILSVLSCIFCVWPIGLVAIIFSYLSSEDARTGNIDSARTKGKVALGLSIASIAVGVITIVAVVIWYFTLVSYVTGY